MNEWMNRQTWDRHAFVQHWKKNPFFSELFKDWSNLNVKCVYNSELLKKPSPINI